ncbi:MAG: NFACT family protein [Clostridia bacterium]|nr:NFACT family protein [Clostridia bacterium]
MAFDGIITNIVVNELDKNLSGSRVEKIHMPTKNDLIISFHTNNREKLKLLVSIDPSNARFHFTNIQKENPEKAPQFCMVLRKYIQGAKFVCINQYGLDRVVSIEFENINELGDLTKYNLYIELMGKYSNIILVNSNNKVLDSIKHVDATMSSIREVLPAREYMLPSPLNKQEFAKMNFDSFTANLQLASMDPYFSKENMTKIIANQFVGFSKTFVDNLLIVSNFKDTINTEIAQNMFNIINLILYNSPNHMVHLIKYDNDYHVDLTNYSTTINRLEVSEFLDKYYGEKERLALLKNSKLNLAKDVNNFKSKYVKNLNRVLDILKEEKNMETYKLYGELISANMYKLHGGEKEITVENYYDNNNQLTIPLNENISASRNSQSYFKKYTKLKNAIAHASEQKKEYEENIDYLDSVLFSIDQIESSSEIQEIKNELVEQGYIHYASGKKKYKDEEALGPYQYDYDGVEIVAGRNNYQNDRLTLKESKKTYTWLHAKDIHGSHVIIKSESPTNAQIEYAAKIAVMHSEAKNSTKVSVDYTLVKNVHKPSGSKPGKVIYTDYKTIII